MKRAEIKVIVEKIQSKVEKMFNVALKEAMSAIKEEIKSVSDAADAAAVVEKPVKAKKAEKAEKKVKKAGGDKFRCRFVDEDGKRCRAHSRGPRYHFLCVDHCEPKKEDPEVDAAEDEDEDEDDK